MKRCLLSGFASIMLVLAYLPAFSMTAEEAQNTKDLDRATLPPHAATTYMMCQIGNHSVEDRARKHSYCMRYAALTPEQQSSIKPLVLADLLARLWPRLASL